MNTNQIRYEDRGRTLFSSETRDFLVELFATALAGVEVILVFLVMCKLFGVL